MIGAHHAPIAPVENLAQWCTPCTVRPANRCTLSTLIRYTDGASRPGVMPHYMKPGRRLAPPPLSLPQLVDCGRGTLSRHASASFRHLRSTQPNRRQAQAEVKAPHCGAMTPKTGSKSSKNTSVTPFLFAVIASYAKIILSIDSNIDPARCKTGADHDPHFLHCRCISSLRLGTDFHRGQQGDFASRADRRQVADGGGDEGSDYGSGVGRPAQRRRQRRPRSVVPPCAPRGLRHHHFHARAGPFRLGRPAGGPGEVWMVNR